MKIVIYLYIFILVGCSQSNEKVIQNPTTAKIESLATKQQTTIIIENIVVKNNNCFWELTNNISDSILLFYRFCDSSDLTLNNWIFDFKDSNNIKCFIHTDATCAVGLLYFDTVVWDVTNELIHLKIEYEQIGYNLKFKREGNYLKDSINEKHFRLIKK